MRAILVSVILGGFLVTVPCSEAWGKNRKSRRRSATISDTIQAEITADASARMQREMQAAAWTAQLRMQQVMAMYAQQEAARYRQYQAARAAQQASGLQLGTGLNQSGHPESVQPAANAIPLGPIRTSLPPPKR